MSTIINCPSCDRKLKVPDELLGKKVKCPGCATIFAAEEFEEKDAAAEEPSQRPRRPAREEAIEEEERPSREGRKARRPEDEYEEEEDLPRSRRRRDQDEDEDDEAPRREPVRADWGRVAKGLTFVLMAIVIQIVGVIVLAGIGGVIGGAAGFAAAKEAAQKGNQAGAAPVVLGGAGFMVLTFLGIALALTCQGLKVLGLFNCMSAPTKNNAQQLARVALILACVYLALSLITQVMGLINPAVAVGANPFAALAAVSISGILSIIAMFVLLGELIAFLMFLRATALNIRKHGLAQTSKYLLIFGLTIVGLFVVSIGVLLAVGVGAVAAAGAGNAPAGGAFAGGMLLSGLCMCVDGLMAFGFFIWYIVNLVQVRSAVAEYASRRGY
ncbi:MAG: zinc-ribbon domain-containing protein [Gemmataceae bacterium]